MQTTQDQIKSVIVAAQAKKRAGSTEANDPEYAHLLKLLRHYNSLKSVQEGALTIQQRNVLKSQIAVFRLLSTNRPVSKHIADLCYDVNAIDGNVAAAIASLAAESIPQNITRPYAYLAQPASVHDHQRVLVPALLPTPFDPLAAKLQRDRYVANRAEYRIKELESMPSTVSDDSLKLKALIELKSLKLLDLQRKVRSDLSRNLAHQATLSTTIDRTNFRLMKKPSLREARHTEKQERAHRSEKDKKERQKHVDFLTSITNHGKDFLTYHRNQAAKVAKLAGAVSRFHQVAAKDEERRIQRVSQERLTALKANDEVAYLKLLDQSKDTRITHLLGQTNSFLKTLTNAVEKQKSSVQEVSAPVMDDDGEPRDYYDTAHAVKEDVYKQSSLLVGGTLKDYQIKGLQWMVSLYNNRLNGILADEMGLGKTIQTLALITYLMESKRQPGPYLVIVPLSTITNWVLEFEKWAPSVKKIVYKGSPTERRDLQDQIKSGQFNVLLTTYEYIINPKDRPILARIKWIHMIIDEGHRMKNANSKLSITLMQFYSARYRIILTGTPLQNNLPELWALLNFILPKVFNSVKSFDDWFNSPFATATGQERIELNEEEQLLIIRRLHKVLRPFLLRRLKKDVEKDLPDKVELIIKVPMSSLQKKIYEQIRNRRMGGAELAKKKALNNLVMQFRKVCNHPYVFEQVEGLINPMRMTDDNLFRVSGKFELLDRILPKFEATGHRVLMFFQMTAIMDIMEDYLRWRQYSFLRLDGNTKADDRTVMLKTFNGTVDPPFIFLLSTRAGGLGLNLQTADTVIIYDSDWNPHQDLQAQDRAHRIGQKKEVRILRLVTSKSVEEAILARAQLKLDLDGKVIQAGKFDNKTTDHEREELLRTLLADTENDNEGDEEEKEDNAAREGEIEDLELNEIISRNEYELNLFNTMDEKRRKEELKEFRARGGKGVYHRLIQESELPEVFLEDTSVPIVEEVTFTGRGARAKKNVSYELDEGNFDFDDVDDSNVEDAGGRAKRRASVAKGSSGNNEDSLDGAGVKRSRSALADEGISPPKKRNQSQAPDPLSVAERSTLAQSVGYAFAAVQKARDESSRLICEIFMYLPDKKEYADYYEFIPSPISMNEIRGKINSNEYNTVEAFRADFGLMFANAKAYNQEGSQVWLDAETLLQIVNDKLENVDFGADLGVGIDEPISMGDVDVAQEYVDEEDDEDEGDDYDE